MPTTPYAVSNPLPTQLAQGNNTLLYRPEIYAEENRTPNQLLVQEKLGTPTKGEVHAYVTPEQALEHVRAQMLRGDSGPGAAMRAQRLTVNDPVVQNYYKKKNEHASLYANDRQYRKEWDRSHGGSSLSDLASKGGDFIQNVGEAAVVFAPYAGAAYLASLGGNALLGGGGAPGAAAVGSGAPVGGMAGSQAASSMAAAGIPGAGIPGVSDAGVTRYPTGPSGSSSLMDNLLIGGSSLVSGYLSQEATERGIDEIARQYDQTRADFAPWREAGADALGQIQNFDYASIQSDPMYQLANEEALRATNRGNAARGLNLSGNALIGEARTAADIAGNFGNNRWNRLAGLAGVGQTATGSTAQAGAGAANQLSNLYLQQGQGLNNAVQGGMQNYFLNNYLNRA